MTDPSEDFQEALIALLGAITDLGADVYEEPPSTASYPYVTTSGLKVDDDSGECFDGATVTVVFHICDRTPGTKTAKAIGKKLLGAIDREFPMPRHRIVIHETMSQSYSPDPESPVRGTIVQRYELAAI